MRFLRISFIYIFLQSLNNCRCGTDNRESVCIESDRLAKEAMDYSKCSCLQLSTQPDSIHFHMEGDFCHRNSARIMCQHLERCGRWNCRIGDFMCPRHEYEKKSLKYAGRGCISPAGKRASITMSLLIGALVGLVVLLH